MPQENVEVVERMFDAVARHDTEAVLDAYDPDIEHDFSGESLGGLLGDTVYRGHDGMRRLVRDRYEAWESFEDDCQELIDAGERVVTFVVTSGRARSSGVDTEMRHYGVWTLRDGKIIRVAWFYDRKQALEAAGLRE